MKLKLNYTNQREATLIAFYGRLVIVINYIELSFHLGIKPEDV